MPILGRQLIVLTAWITRLSVRRSLAITKVASRVIIITFSLLEIPAISLYRHTFIASISDSTINLSNVRFPVRHLDYIALEVSLAIAYLFFDLDPAQSRARIIELTPFYTKMYVINLPPLPSLAVRLR